MRYSTDAQPFALYRFPQPGEEYDLLMLSRVVCFTTDAVTFEPVVIPATEPDATSVPAWVPRPEIIRATDLSEAAKHVNRDIANRIDADYDTENWNNGWRHLFKCRWCEESITPIIEDVDFCIWASVHDPDCAVRTFTARRPRRVIPHQHSI